MLPGWIRFRLGKWQFVVVVFALAYAFLVTLNLGYIPLQWDEVNHFNGALLLLRGQIWQYAAINSFYPPIYNLVTAAYFALAGASVLTGRLVTVTFSGLSIFIVYKIAKEMYGEKTAVASAVLFGVMPGIVWLSGLALIEMMLLFVFCVSMLFFFRWLQTDRKLDLTLSLVALAVGVVVKYQIIVVAPIVMVVSLLVLGKSNNLKAQTTEFIHSRRVWLGVLLVALAGIFLYAFYASGLLTVWLYAIQVGNSGQSWYSNRFSAPIFYLLEMVVPYNDKHPISLLLYGLGLAGLGFLAVSYLRRFYSNSKQAVALCYASVSCLSHFCHCTRGVSYWLCTENLAISKKRVNQKTHRKIHGGTNDSFHGNRRLLQLGGRLYLGGARSTPDSNRTSHRICGIQRTSEAISFSSLRPQFFQPRHGLVLPK
jgi:4-amino-4-deoxy-L-arabinose transferase-like glycosyltransferase